jgi:hypothetical protein
MDDAVDEDVNALLQHPDLPVILVNALQLQGEIARLCCFF